MQKYEIISYLQNFLRKKFVKLLYNLHKALIMNDEDIKKLRKKYQLTQAELALQCGVETRTVQNWEKGQTIPESKQKLLEMIAEKCETNSQSISGNTNNIKSNNINSDETINKITALFEKQLQTKDEQIDRLLKIIENDRGM